MSSSGKPLSPQDCRLLSWVLGLAAMALSAWLLYWLRPAPGPRVSGSFGGIIVVFVGGLSLLISLPLSLAAIAFNTRSLPTGQGVSGWRYAELALVGSPPVIDILMAWLLD